MCLSKIITYKNNRNNGNNKIKNKINLKIIGLGEKVGRKTIMCCLENHGIIKLKKNSNEIIGSSVYYDYEINIFVDIFNNPNMDNRHYDAYIFVLDCNNILNNHNIKKNIEPYKNNKIFLINNKIDLLKKSQLDNFVNTNLNMECFNILECFNISSFTGDGVDNMYYQIVNKIINDKSN